MATIVWGEDNARLYETGVDRGVLYVGENPGVAWNGLVSVNEKASGGQAIAHYIDGEKYLNYADSEETELTLSALYSPPEFDACDGTRDIMPGFSIRHQPRIEFGLSYRTKVGNPLLGSDYAYKIHIIFNALAAPSDVNYQTETDTLSIQPMTWDLTTRPIVAENYVGSAHFVIDTTKLTRNIVAPLERILYGSEWSEPRMPSIGEIVTIIESGGDNYDNTFATTFWETF